MPSPTLKPCHRANMTHGAYHRDRRLYGIWNGMHHRCEDAKREKFPSYGGRGIFVCEEWSDPNAFMDWAFANGYDPSLQLDRKDNDGPYSPSNCQWATRSENCRHTRRSKTLTIRGEEKTIAEWKDILGISQYTLYWWHRTFGKEECERRAVAAWNRRAGEEETK